MIPFKASNQAHKLFSLSLVAIAMLLVLAACQPTSYTKPDALIDWRNLEEGKNEAKGKGMPVLIDFFFGAKCMRCDYFEKTLYSDPEVADAINKEFIPVRVYLNLPLTEDETALLKKLSPQKECVLAFLDQNGEVISDENGQPISSMEVLNKEQYLSYMAKALSNLR
jgi:thioredoxin-related protein